MVKRVNPSRLNLRIEVGRQMPTGIINPNSGEDERKFTPQFLIWGGQWKLNTNQQLTLQGLGLKEEVMFVVRHRPELRNDYQLRIADQIYEIDIIDFDDGQPPDGYDLITAHEWGINHA